MRKGKLIVGLDVGTTRICAVVGEINPVRMPGRAFFSDVINPVRGYGGDFFSNGLNGRGAGAAHNRIDIIGVGSSPSKGLRKGVVVNIEATVESIKRAVKEAETIAGVEIKAVHVGIAGGHINNFTSHGVIAVKEREIGQRDIDRVIDAAKAVPIPLDREVLHVVPVGFAVDGQNGINDPSGMGGVRLEANVRIITGAVTSVQNLIKSCQRAGLDVIDIVLEPLASAEVALNGEEKDLGVGILDVGGGTTDIALFHGGNLCHTAVLSLGGNNFTNDVAIGLRVPASEAEKIKKNFGCSMMSMVSHDEEIGIAYPGDKPNRRVPRQHLIEILQPRAEELFYLIKEELAKSGFLEVMTSGVVLTGGAVLMKGMDVMAENILELPVRVGHPSDIGGITDIVCSPMYTTGVGLALHGARGIINKQKFGSGHIFNGVTTRMKECVKGIFR